MEKKNQVKQVKSKSNTVKTTTTEKKQRPIQRKWVNKQRGKEMEAKAVKLRFTNKDTGIMNFISDLYRDNNMSPQYLKMLVDDDYIFELDINPYASWHPVRVSVSELHKETQAEANARYKRNKQKIENRKLAKLKKAEAVEKRKAQAKVNREKRERALLSKLQEKYKDKSSTK